MEIETLKKCKKKQILIGGICAIAILSVGVLATSRAKYKLTESINIANGTVNYKVPDFQIIAMYKSEDGTNYTELEGRMPESGYIINEEKSYCNLITGGEDTEAILKTVDGNHVIANLIKGDKCYLYFDKEKSPAEKTLASLGLTPSTGTPNFSKTSCTSGCVETTVGIYKTEDGMYGSESYYWRGNTENNYVKFANLCWRIIRINGDGSIRLIYDGTTCHANGTSTPDSIAKTSQAYNASYDRSEYVGYTYTSGSQRGTGTASNLKTQTESWYKTNITDKGFDGKVATGKFCNDRNTASGYTWASQPSSTFNYAAYGRLGSAKTPTLSCTNTSDVYSLKAGAITADEVAFAGGVYGQANNSYYLYNGQYYWTMSPYNLYYRTSDSTRWAQVFFVYNNGQLSNWNVDNTTPGVRPVINLNADVTFSSGNGQKDTPFIVAD